MRRFFSIILSAVMLISVLPLGSVFAVGHDRAVITGSYDIPVGQKTEAEFVFEADSAYKKVTLVSDDQKSAVDMTMTKGGNIYSADLTLKSDTYGVDEFSVVADGEVVFEYDICYYNEQTAYDIKAVNDIKAQLDIIENDMVSSGADTQSLYSAVEDYLLSCDNIDKVVRDDDCINFVYEKGFNYAYTYHTEECCKSDYDCEDYEIKSDIKASNVGTLTNPNILIVRPFRTYSGEEPFHNDRYLQMAEVLAETTGGYITILDDEDATPQNLLDNFWQNGVIMYDAHGIDMNGKSYFYSYDGPGYSTADLTAGRVVSMIGSHMLVNGEYFSHYYNQSGRSFENSFLYFGVCRGMLYDTLSVPFLDTGACAVLGYDKKVTFGFEADNLLTIFPKLTEMKNDNYSYSLKECMDYAVEQNGLIDGYGGEGAKLAMAGDPNFRLVTPPVAATGIEFAQDNYTIVTNKIGYVQPVVSPANACGYEQVWSSSDESVVKVIGTRKVLGMSEGSADITCTIKGNGYEYSATCTVTVEYIPVTRVIAELSGAAASPMVGQSRDIKITVQPENASNPNIRFESTNPGVADVSGTGTVTSLTPGKAQIYCISEDTGLYDVIDITVGKSASYRLSEGFEADLQYAIVSNSYEAALVAQLTSDGEYFSRRDCSATELGFLNGNISAPARFSFKNASNGGFYIYNEANNVYISRSESGEPALTDNAQTVFEFTAEGGLKARCNDEDTAYLRCSNKGFKFGKESQSRPFELYRFDDWGNSELYSTVTFKDNNATFATQVVRKGTNAVPANIFMTENKTFLGWDKPLADINGDLEVNSLWSNEVYDESAVVVTFMDYDNTVLSTVVSNDGIITAPTPPVHDGMEFIGWSENYATATYNMTVFAMYKDPNEGGEVGDVNNDGNVNTGDAVMILRHCAGLTELDAETLERADVTGDGNINAGDAVFILRLIAGLN